MQIVVGMKAEAMHFGTTWMDRLGITRIAEHGTLTSISCGPFMGPAQDGVGRIGMDDKIVVDGGVPWAPLLAIDSMD